MSCLFAFYEDWKKNKDKKMVEDAQDAMQLQKDGLTQKQQYIEDTILKLKEEAARFMKQKKRASAIQKLKEAKAKEAQLVQIFANIELLDVQMNSLSNFWVNRTTIQSTKDFLKIQKTHAGDKQGEELDKLVDKIDDGQSQWHEIQSKVDQVLQTGNNYLPATMNVSEEDLMTELEQLVTEEDEKELKRKTENMSVEEYDSKIAPVAEAKAASKEMKKKKKLKEKTSNSNLVITSAYN